MRDQAHPIIFRTLRIIDAICKSHEINYCLEYGTLLELIKHKGSIPLDNEADLRTAYGDYMILPPEGSRVFPDIHVFKACDHPEAVIWKNKN